MIGSRQTRVTWMLETKSFGDNYQMLVTVLTRIPTVKLKIPGKLFLKLNPELLLHSSYSF